MKEVKNHIRILRIITGIISISCMVIFVPWLAGLAYLNPLPYTVLEQVDDAINYDLDGIIVYIDQKGKAPELYSAGWNNRDLKIPMKPDTLFKIASISKLYVAAAAAMLISENKLSLDDTITDFFPELAARIENAEQITLRMLLQHRSGIPNYVYDAEFSWTRKITEVSEDLALVLDDPAEFSPGSDYQYSNTNYLLIGNILDKALGYRHQAYIKNRILTPLGLTQTYSMLSEVDASKVSSGYTMEYNGDIKEMVISISPSGSMISTAQDTGVFLRALNDGSLLSKKAQTIYSSVYAYEHTGLLPGYSSIARYHKDIDAVVIQFVNTSGENSWLVLEIIYNRIVEILSKK